MYATQEDIEHQLPLKKVRALSDDRTYLGSSSVATLINSTDTSVTLASSSSFPATGRIRIDNEIMTYTSNALNTLSGLTRGTSLTVATSHGVGNSVVQMLEADDETVTRCITDADALIDSYCRNVTSTLPFSPVPDIIRKISVDISIFYLFSRRGMASEDDRQRYTDAMNLLKDIANGKITFGADEDDITRETHLETDTYYEDRIFTMASKTNGTPGSFDGF